jgi:hypothetical protein
LLSAHATPHNNNAYQFDGWKAGPTDWVTRDAGTAQLTGISSAACRKGALDVEGDDLFQEISVITRRYELEFYISIFTGQKS